MFAFKLLFILPAMCNYGPNPLHSIVDFRVVLPLYRQIRIYY